MQPLFPYVFLESRKDLCLQFVLQESMVCFQSIEQMQNIDLETDDLFSELITIEPEDFFTTSFGALEKLIHLLQILSEKEIAKRFKQLSEKVWDAFENDDLIEEKDFTEEFREIFSELFPLFIQERDNENIALFLMRYKEEIEPLFFPECFQELFSDEDALKINLIERYKSRGFESIVRTIQHSHDPTR